MLIKKSIITASIILLLAAGTTQARYPDVLCNSQNVCGTTPKPENRAFVDLQEQIDQLSAENAQLKLQLQNQIPQGTNSRLDAGLSARVTNLETQMTALETAVSGLRQWVQDVFRWIQKILKIKIL